MTLPFSQVGAAADDVLRSWINAREVRLAGRESSHVCSFDWAAMLFRQSPVSNPSRAPLCWIFSVRPTSGGCEISMCFSPIRLLAFFCYVILFSNFPPNAPVRRCASAVFQSLAALDLARSLCRYQPLPRKPYGLRRLVSIRARPRPRCLGVAPLECRPKFLCRLLPLSELAGFFRAIGYPALPRNPQAERMSRCGVFRLA
jgi:hypothetical protein